MELRVAERLLLLNVLPREGDLTTLRIVRDLRHTLSFTEEEYQALGLKQTGPGKVAWTPEADVAKDVEIGPTAMSIIAEGFQRLSDQKKIRVEWLPFVEQFLNGHQAAG